MSAVRARTGRAGALAALAAWTWLGCQTEIAVRYEPLVAEPPREPATTGTPLLLAGTPDAPHREVGLLEASGRAPRDRLEHRMRLRARELGIDAVIRVRLSERRPDEVPPWLGWTRVRLQPMRRLEGTAVVFTGGPELGHPAVGPAVRGQGGP